MNLNNVFARFAQKGSSQISLDEMLIAMSRVNDNIQLGDIKELHRIIVGASSSHDIEEVKVSISELVQILTI